MSTYAWEYDPATNKNIRAHVAIAERALGRKLPKGAEVHHVNGDSLDNRNENLVICESRSYHRLLHARMRILKAGGNPDADKVCGRCKLLKPRAQFKKRSARMDGLDVTCRQCWKELLVIYKQQGPRRPQIKLTESQVDDIRASGEPKHQLAAKYGVTWGRINDIKRGTTWKKATKQ